ncbi:MAG: DUF362 domain-containing protein [Planctomycetaceae bacterium]|nr:DUF362 domain-containing protein [Planctomycetaceae bacterium]
MGAIYEEFLRELESLGRKHAGHPKRELIDLFLMALENEEIVAIAYRESVMAARLRAMPLPDDVRELIRHALIWAWKDEEMHAIYIRGAILKLGNRWLRWKAFARQTAGSIGGWAASVQQHVRWRDCPLARSLSGLITGAGILFGAVPREVREHLQYGSFRRFCLFNIEAERTAWMCWSRILALAETQPDVPTTLLEDFRTILADEDRHHRLFAILAECVDEENRLAEGITPQLLAERISTVGEFFLPRSHRGASVADNPLGAGGVVRVIGGTTADEKRPLFRRLLNEAALTELIAERCRKTNKPASELRVAIKTNFMMGTHQTDRAHLIDRELIAELADVLHEHGCREVAVLENRNIYDSFHSGRTVREVARYFGYESPRYRLVDLFEEQVPHHFGRGVGQHSVGQTWRDADLRITFGKMRSHPVEMVYLSMATLEALGARCEEYIFTERQAHRETALMMLLSDFPPHFALLDAYDQAADGLAGVMGCRRPKSPRRLYAATDALALDLVAARHMGVREVRVSQLLRTAIHWFGDPTPRMEVRGPDEPLPDWRGPYHSDLSTLLSFMAYPVYEHGSGRGALFVSKMDRDAFPPLAPESSMLRLGRHFTRAVLGLKGG